MEMVPAVLQWVGVVLRERAKQWTSQTPLDVYPVFHTPSEYPHPPTLTAHIQRRQLSEWVKQTLQPDSDRQRQQFELVNRIIYYELFDMFSKELWHMLMWIVSVDLKLFQVRFLDWPEHHRNWKTHRSCCLTAYLPLLFIWYVIFPAWIS